MKAAQLEADAVEALAELNWGQARRLVVLLCLAFHMRRPVNLGLLPKAPEHRKLGFLNDLCGQQDRLDFSCEEVPFGTVIWGKGRGEGQARIGGPALLFHELEAWSGKPIFEGCLVKDC
eukprot:2898721-Amphidinium_carterae.2